MAFCLRRREFIAGLGGPASWHQAMPVSSYLGASTGGIDPH
jgi:hypothetical protein